MISCREQAAVRLKLELEQAQSRLAGETKAGKVTAESLQNQLKQKAGSQRLPKPCVWSSFFSLCHNTAIHVSWNTRNGH